MFSKSTGLRLHSVSLRATSRLISPSNLIHNWVFNIVFSENMKELKDDRWLSWCKTSCYN